MVPLDDRGADDLGPSSGTAIDPVCGMTVVPGQAAGGSASHEGTAQHFCSPHCRARFLADPAAFVGKARSERTAPTQSSPPAEEGLEYTCPMIVVRWLLPDMKTATSPL